MTYPPPPSPPPPPPPGYPEQPGYGAMPPGPQPDNYLVWAILCTVLCCLPLGIVSIINAAKVSGLWASGQYAEAQKASENAKKFAMWGAIVGVVVGVIYAIIAFAGGMADF